MEVEMAERKCGCGKLLARYDNGTLYLWCKGCRKEIALPVDELKKPTRTKSRCGKFPKTS